MYFIVFLFYINNIFIDEPSRKHLCQVEGVTILIKNMYIDNMELQKFVISCLANITYSIYYYY